MTDFSMSTEWDTTSFIDHLFLTQTGKSDSFQEKNLEDLAVVIC